MKLQNSFEQEAQSGEPLIPATKILQLEHSITQPGFNLVPKIPLDPALASCNKQDWIIARDLGIPEMEFLNRTRLPGSLHWEENNI
ncbi:hypothetical protein EVAR_17194_1 [Eumeta japonica]|uniref:Uncharacterized protein n=1 Tax=Eumeta variegata TaxID=151549 RepID=A0A4C1U9R4_EUMVA|nr:hypothetical protein EVAR_17194_1 [Eumeta japonica]